MIGSANGLVGGPGRHVLDGALPVELRDRPLNDKPSEIHDGDAVSDLEDVIQVVRNKHHCDTVFSEPLDQVQHLARLRDAERRRGLVHDHKLCVGHHGLGDGDRLALTA